MKAARARPAALRTSPDPEVLEHHRRHVAQRPLLALGGIVGPAADEEQRAERVAGVQRAVAAAAGVADAAPVDSLIARGQRDDEVAGVRCGQRGEDARERIRVLVAARSGRRPRAPPEPPGRPRPPSARRAGRLTSSPRTETCSRSPCRSTTAVVARPRASRRGRLLRSPSSAALTASRVGPLPLPRQQVDVGGAAGRADGELGQLGPVVGGRQHRPLAAEQLGQRQAAADRGLRVVGEQDHGVVGEERLEPTPRLDQLGEAVVGLGDRLDARLRPMAMRVVVVVGRARRAGSRKRPSRSSSAAQQAE